MRRDPAGAFLGVGPAARALRAAVRDAASSRSTVLLAGETGSGKGLVAHALHAASPASAAPWVHVDCAALAASLIESELFGHERGAFTGAAASRIGRLERAGAGTLFLDEIGELAPGLQAKLLRVLEDRAFERVGGGRTQRFAARVVAATHRDLRHEVDRGRFRLDLYYRLDVLRIRVPPLRERPEDLPLLVEELLARLAHEMQRPPPRLRACALARLQRESWPGNVRELRNLLERLTVGRAGACLGERELDPFLDARAAGAPPPATPREAPRERIARALLESGGNVSVAARRLGLARSTLRGRIARYGIQLETTSRSAITVRTPL